MELAKKVIGAELELFEKHFKDAVKSRVSLLDRIMQYIVKRKGKQMRPMFVLLSAKLHGEINDSSYRAASLVELLHTATLVHDDVVDESFERRGFFSINALWKNKIAVLVGDYLLSKGLLLSLENKDFTILTILSNAVKNMSEGELLQMEKTRNLNFDESVYYEIINGKTASLLASSCAAGASSVSNDPAVIEQMRAFGENVGMAFQIKDDLFDYGEAKVGKPTGNDIKEKKLTLPLIHIFIKYSQNFYRAAWILKTLDAGFWTAMRFKPRPLRSILSIVLSLYFSFFPDHTEEVVRLFILFNCRRSVILAMLQLTSLEIHGRNLLIHY
jgi:octaprenyl-diphosphate synthase